MVPPTLPARSSRSLMRSCAYVASVVVLSAVASVQHARHIARYYSVQPFVPHGMVTDSRSLSELQDTSPRTGSTTADPTLRNHTSPKPPKLDPNDSRSLAFLPLLPWEVESQSDNNRACNPPSGIPSYCCVGSLSSGGRMAHEPNKCTQPQAKFETAERMALASLVPLLSPHESVQCDWCRMVDILVEFNWTMAFQGDSLTRQTFVGIECELRRRNLYHVELRQTFVAAMPKPRWRYGLDEIYELVVTPHNATSAHTAVIRFYAMYRPLEDMSEVERYVARHNDVLIFDHGLHYGIASGDEEFRSEMTSLLQTLVYAGQSKRPWKLLAWRETSSQHFNTTGGHFLPGVHEQACVAMEAAHVHRGNRLNPIMRGILADLRMDNDLVILPFREYTSQLHELHVTGDCSHYCSTPSLWLPLYRTLRMAMDEAVVRFQLNDASSQVD